MAWRINALFREKNRFQDYKVMSDEISDIMCLIVNCLQCITQPPVRAQQGEGDGNFYMDCSECPIDQDIRLKLVENTFFDLWKNFAIENS